MDQNSYSKTYVKQRQTAHRVPQSEKIFNERSSS